MTTKPTNRAFRRRTALLLATLLATGSSALAQVAHPEKWPARKASVLVDRQAERTIDRMLARMTLEEKIGQMIQGEIRSVTPEDLRRYPLGSILGGGGAAPLGATPRSGPAPWVASRRAYDAVALEARPGHEPIPIIFGFDAVHGANNIRGATLFPHNVALGAARDPELIRRIGRATAEESAASGIEWTFAPTLAVPQNDRWGRTLEGYSEDPALVASYAGAMIEGLQGRAGLARPIARGFVAATAKHFVGDGGTHDGVDQGDTRVSEDELIRIHFAGYGPAIDAGAMTVMASFNSWNGQKMHGNRSLLTGVLKERMKFGGFVVGDWNGHAQLPGCTADHCAAAFNAGVDMAMAPNDWKALFANTLADVKARVIPLARVDDAVRRILRIKLRLGLFGTPRPYETKPEVVGSAQHRALAREAVRKSLVLLKNDGVLPIKANARVLVAGEAADQISQQSGGWTLTWQGDGNTNADFPNAQSIWAGLAEAVRAGGGTATLSPTGAYDTRPDVAIVVFGETPYAETAGDLATLEFEPGDKRALALLKKFKAAGVPTVSVFLSGRPLWVNPEINQSDAFVAAWLPGSEGGGIADVLVGTADGRARHDFTGRLSYSWPRRADQFALNRGAPGYEPLFPLGFGLAYAHGGQTPRLSEDPGLDAASVNRSVVFSRGQVRAPFALQADPAIRQEPVDTEQAQGGALRFGWSGTAPVRLRFTGPVLDFAREAKADHGLSLTLRVIGQPAQAPIIALAGGRLSGAGLVAAPGTWQTMLIPFACFAAAGADFSRITDYLTIEASAPLALDIAEVKLVGGADPAKCPARP
ncbi:glycoside hydrolase family 3 N-terminal domain-containing protein [Novosphingobium bradum]|uniref:Glycoside hydrolase family 3 N-terminal domain-containing protein n=1 Tax=Novosphingobium bradum TaxID=1737444 RepID=A0ABV7IR76_9SPHN